MTLKSFRKNLKGINSRITGARRKNESSQENEGRDNDNDDENDEDEIYEQFAMNMSTRSVDYDNFFESASKPWSVDLAKELSTHTNSVRDMSSAGQRTVEPSTRSVGTILTRAMYMESVRTIEEEDGDSDCSDDRQKLGIPTRYATARQAAHKTTKSKRLSQSSMAKIPKSAVMNVSTTLLSSERSSLPNITKFEDLWSAGEPQKSSDGKNSRALPANTHKSPTKTHKPPTKTNKQPPKSHTPPVKMATIPDSTCSISECTFQCDPVAPKKKTTHRGPCKHRTASNKSKKTTTSQSAINKGESTAKKSKSAISDASAGYSEDSAARKPRTSLHTSTSLPVGSIKSRRSDKTCKSMPTTMDKKTHKLAQQFEDDLQSLLNHVGNAHGVSSSTLSECASPRIGNGRSVNPKITPKAIPRKKDAGPEKSGVDRSRSKSPDVQTRASSTKPERRSRASSVKPERRSRSSSKKPERKPRSRSNRPVRRSRSTSRDTERAPRSTSKRPNKQRSSSKRPERRSRSTSRDPERQSRSSSKNPNKERSSSKRPERRSRSTSRDPERQSRSSSKNPNKERSSSKRPGRRSRSTSRDPERQSRSSSKNPNKQRSSSKRPERRSRSTSRDPERQSRSSSKNPNKERSSSKRPERRSRGTSETPNKRRSRSKNPIAERESSKASEKRRSTSKPTENLNKSSSYYKKSPRPVAKTTTPEIGYEGASSLSKSLHEAAKNAGMANKGGLSQSLHTAKKVPRKVKEESVGLSQSLHAAKKVPKKASNVKSVGLSQSLHETKMKSPRPKKKRVANLEKVNEITREGMHETKKVPRKDRKATTELSQSVHRPKSHEEQSLRSIEQQPKPKSKASLWSIVIPKAPMYQQNMKARKEDPPGIPSPKTRKSMIDQQRQKKSVVRDDATVETNVSSSSKRRKPRRKDSSSVGFADVSAGTNKPPRRGKRNAVPNDGGEAVWCTDNGDDNSCATNSTASSIQSQCTRGTLVPAKQKSNRGKGISRTRSAAGSVKSTGTKTTAASSSCDALSPRTPLKRSDSFSNRSTASTIFSTGRSLNRSRQWTKDLLKRKPSLATSKAAYAYHANPFVDAQ